MHEIRDLSLWESGEQKIQWVKSNMPLLRSIEADFAKTKPFTCTFCSMEKHRQCSPVSTRSKR